MTNLQPQQEIRLANMSEPIVLLTSNLCHQQIITIIIIIHLFALFLSVLRKIVQNLLCKLNKQTIKVKMTDIKFPPSYCSM